MAEDVDVSGDVAQSVDAAPAVVELSELAQRGQLSAERAATLRQAYARVHDLVMRGLGKEKHMLEQARQLNTQLTDERERLRGIDSKTEERKGELGELRRKLMQAQHDADRAGESADIVDVEMEATRQELEALRNDLRMQRQAEQDRLRPQIDSLNEDIATMRADIERHKMVLGQVSTELTDHSQREEALKASIGTTTGQLAEDKVKLQMRKQEPDKLHKFVSMLEQQLASQTDERDRLDAQLDQMHSEQDAANKRVKSLEEERLRLGGQVQMQRSQMEQMDGVLADLKRAIAVTIAQIEDGQAEKLKLELDLEHAVASNRQETEKQTRQSKLKDMEVQEIRRRERMLEDARGLIPGLQTQLRDMNAELERMRAQRKQLEVQQKEINKDVDLLMDNVLAQEQASGSKSTELMEAIKRNREAEEHILQLKREESALMREVQEGVAKREMQAHEANAARTRTADTEKELKVQELSLRELVKQHRDLEARAEQVGKLYEALKSERNKIIAAIQLSTQAAAEMREKLKIFENELDILRTESETRDKALIKERFDFEHTFKERDGLRQQANKLQHSLRERHTTEEQLKNETEKLNSIISIAEADLMDLKRLFERVVQQRNYVGIQLIDRNDELCVLYEKNNVQESRLRHAEVEFRRREQEARMLQLEINDQQREVSLLRQALPRLPEFEQRVVHLIDQVHEQRALGEDLCRRLEDPTNVERYHLLGGADKSVEELTEQGRILEARLNQKDEQLLEKKLALENLTSLIESSRNEAVRQRDTARSAAQDLNVFHHKLSKLQRKMMATHSERALYQATAMRLEQEKTMLVEALETARELLERGLAPTEDADIEWQRMERRRAMQERDRSLRAQMSEMEAVESMVGATRTTAEPRPAAYIPDDELGLPKPYGGHAPFKPSEAGASMRHIRRPQPREVEI